MAQTSYKNNLIQNPAREVGANKDLKGRQNPARGKRGLKATASPWVHVPLKPPQP